MKFLSVVPIIIPSSPQVRAEIAEEMAFIGQMIVVGFAVLMTINGIVWVIKGLVKAFRFTINKIKKGVLK